MNYQLETHCHTAESSPCATVSAKQSVNMYAQNGYQGIVTTDHFSRAVLGSPAGQSWDSVVTRFLQGYQTAKAQESICKIDVFLGMEIRFPGNEDDFLVYGFTEAFLRKHPWLYEMDLAHFVEIAREEGLFVSQAHPFRDVCNRANPALLHGVEVYNGNPRHDPHNDLAVQWCRDNHLHPMSGSDFHEMEDPIRAGICMSVQPKNERELVQTLFESNYSILRNE